MDLDEAHLLGVDRVELGVLRDLGILVLERQVKGGANVEHQVDLGRSRLGEVGADQGGASGQQQVVLVRSRVGEVAGDRCVARGTRVETDLRQVDRIVKGQFEK